MIMKSLLLFLFIGCCIAGPYIYEICDKTIGIEWTNTDTCNEWYSAVFTLTENKVETCMRVEPRSSDEIIVMIRRLSHPKSRFKIDKVESYLEINKRLWSRDYGYLKYYEHTDVAHDFIAYHFKYTDLPAKKKLVRDIHQLLVSNDDCK